MVTFYQVNVVIFPIFFRNHAVILPIFYRDFDTSLIIINF